MALDPAQALDDLGMRLVKVVRRLYPIPLEWILATKKGGMEWMAPHFKGMDGKG